MDTQRAAQAGHEEAGGFWPKGWWSIVDFKIGIVPLPVFVVLLAVIALYALTGSVPSDILMAIVLLSMADSPAPNWATPRPHYATWCRRA